MVKTILTHENKYYFFYMHTDENLLAQMDKLIV